MREPYAGRFVGGAAVVAAAVLLLSPWGCSNLDKQAPPDLVGPSDSGVSVDLSAAPDTVNADGVSQSTVRLIVRNSRGEPVVNQPVLFHHTGDGWMYPASGSLYVGPVQTGIVMATDGRGSTQVVYVAGYGIGQLSVYVRPYGTDASYGFYKTVTIWQQ